jgi:hypothetical protein
MSGYYGPYTEEFFTYPRDELKNALQLELERINHNMAQIYKISDVHVILIYEQLEQRRIYTERALRRVLAR